MLHAKELPAGWNCEACAVSTESQLLVNALCEKMSVEGELESGMAVAWLLLVSPILWVAVALSSGKGVRELGRNVSFALPLRLCENCQARVQNDWWWSRRKTLRRLLQKVPVYADLLRRYPKTKVWIDN
jgi:hypothetical protein